jgi:hypothetical protein
MNGNLPSTKALAIAQQLFAQEAGTRGPSGASMRVAVQISEKLRRPLTTLTGSSGFRVLLSRALTLAKVQDPALGSVQVRPDGALFGFGDLPDDQGHAGEVLIAQLIGLLETFIGPDLTWRLVADVWPELPALEAENNTEGGK